MKNEEKFNDILNECVERCLSGESLEQCLKSHPEYASELEPLLRTVLTTKQVCSLSPRPEFKARARLQFRAAMQDKFQPVEPRRSRWLFAWHSAWATAVAVVVIVVLLAGGTVAAAGTSMPDQPLYPVKIAAEEVRVMATQAPLSKAELLAELADKRVSEIVYLASKNDAAKIEATAQRLNTHLAEIASLTEVKKERISAGMAAPAKTDAARERAPALFAPAPQVAPAPAPSPALAPAPPPAPAAPKPTATPEPAPTPRPTPAPAPKLPAAAPAPKTATAPATKAAPTPVTPAAKEKAQIIKALEREKLKQVVMRYAINHPARINEALNKAPANVRPALRKVLEESVSAYQKAIKNIEEQETE